MRMILESTNKKLFGWKHLNNQNQRRGLSFLAAGFTLTEILVIVGILAILVVLAIPAFRLFEKESDLSNTAEEIVNILRLAQSKTLASEGASQWGVYFSISTIPQQYTLFKGSSYASRDIAFDEINKLPKTVEIYNINLAGGEEVVFNRVDGKALPSGDLGIRLISNPSRAKSIYIESSGQISLTAPSVPVNGRIIDSRHVHFDYSRAIATSTETITLVFTFDTSTTTEIITIANNLKNGQIYWERQVTVGGEIQELIIQTHRLNNPDTQFSIHRDRRYNTKALKVEISGDTSGTLIEYSADGLTTIKSSIYASPPLWQ